jgi:hypothetical protein
MFLPKINLITSLIIFNKVMRLRKLNFDPSKSIEQNPNDEGSGL